MKCYSNLAVRLVNSETHCTTWKCERLADRQDGDAHRLSADAARRLAGPPQRGRVQRQLPRVRVRRRRIPGADLL